MEYTLLYSSPVPADDPTGLDFLIYAVIALFLMSIVTEKLVVLIRTYPKQCQIISFLCSGFFVFLSFNSFRETEYSQWLYFFLGLLLVFLTIELLITLIGSRIIRLAESAEIENRKEDSTKQNSNQNSPTNYRVVKWDNKATIWIYNRAIRICRRIKHLVKLLIKINPFKNTNKIEGQPTPKAAKKEITLLSFIIGFFIAAAFNVSLFEMFSIVPGEFPKEINWNNSLFNNVFQKWTFNSDFKITAITFFGFLLTGFFLSFGSKFFHDLLDRLYYIKRAKRAIGEPETYFLDNPEAVANIVKTYESDFVMAAFTEAKSYYMGIDSVKAVSLCRDESGYYAEVLHEANSNKFRKKYLYRMSDGRDYNLRIKLKPLTTPIVAHNFHLGSKIFDNRVLRFGTMGCQVKSLDENDKSTYIVTCGHTLFNPKSVKSDQDYIPGLTAKVNEPSPMALGDVKKVSFNHYIDAALIQLKGINPSEIINIVPGRGMPGDVRKLERADEGNTEVWFCGATSKTKSGTIQGVYGDASIKFEGDFEYELRSLLVVKDGDRGISQEGDSGSLVLDRENRVLGLVVAGSPEATFIIPMDRILEKFNAKILGND